MVLVMACGVAVADEKIDAKKLVGKWESKDPKAPKLVVELAKDGKITITGKEGDKEFTATGTYKLEGNKISVAVKFGDKEEKMTRTISKLTDTELVSKDDATGKEDTLTRIKEKKDK